MSHYMCLLSLLVGSNKLAAKGCKTWLLPPSETYYQVALTPEAGGRGQW